MCSFFGNPVPSVEWSVNGVNYDIKTKVIESSSEVISYITISNVNFHENHGNVSCSAKSILGQITKSGFVDVHVKPKVSFSSSIFYVDLASNVTFPTCNVLSNPPAKVTWRKGFGEIQKSRSIVSEFGNFIINDVQVEDDGFYVCTAENYLGSDSVIIQLKTKPLKISHGSPTESVFFNYPQTLWCGTYGRAERISAKWRSLITNQVIKHSEFKTKSFLNTTIRISEGGSFSCEFTDGITTVERISIIKSFIFSSNILKTPDEYKKIYELLKEVDAPTSSISRCMQMNEFSDYEVSSFWTNFQNCYYNKNTLVLVKVKDQNWLLGGFTDIQWSNLQNLSSKKTFVFTTYPDFKIKTKDLSRTQTCLNSMFGRSYPCFGLQEFTFEEHDTTFNFYQKTALNYGYKRKYQAVIKSKLLLGSETTVQIQNIEVFYLT
ncbi:contactin-5-like isoform X2 [Hydra vulgaris]|uniref:contactin-5-like isoform X2 n=1 Tax=Hydra vulgaris TaxID=6087 RepID=UPI0032E9F6BF